MNDPMERHYGVEAVALLREAVKQLGESTPEGRAALAEYVAALRRYAEARGPAVLDVLDLAELQAIHATLGEWTS